jgi:hypothetical protein
MPSFLFYVLLHKKCVGVCVCVQMCLCMCTNVSVYVTVSLCMWVWTQCLQFYILVLVWDREWVQTALKHVVPCMTEYGSSIWAVFQTPTKGHFWSLCHWAIQCGMWWKPASWMKLGLENGLGKTQKAYGVVTGSSGWIWGVCKETRLETGGDLKSCSGWRQPFPLLPTHLHTPLQEC